MAESPSPPPLTRASLTRAVAYLTRRDRGLAKIVRAHGLPPLWARAPGFATLVRIILEQQVSLASARAVYGRVAKQLPGGWTTTTVVHEGTAGLMARGITRQKAGYIVALAARIERGELVLRSLGRAPDEQARERLIACPGIGPWTAGIYLLMALRRPDVWPPADVALQNALRRLLAAGRPLTSDEAVEWASRWAPYRSVAARILWSGYLGERSSAVLAAAMRHGWASQLQKSSRRQGARRARRCPESTARPLAVGPPVSDHSLWELQ